MNHDHAMMPGVYDTPEVNRANAEHDRKYGWSIERPNVYCKPDATCTVVTSADKNDPEKLWAEIRVFESGPA